MGCDSVALFVDRAQAVRPDFQVTRSNAGAVAALCRRLEGIPLALELAAARAGVMTPTQMLARLDQRFELLVSRHRDVTPRHRSLRAALEWSDQLLSPDLQQFFARLSVFRGGWTLEAAEAVCGCWVLGLGSSELSLPNIQHPTPDHQPPVLEFLSRLRECSLVQAEEGAEETRFRLLETVRDYAAEQLAPEEQRELSRRHAAHYLALVERAQPALKGPEQGVWLERLEREHDNLRAVLAWSVAGGEVETGLRLGGALWWFWSLRGYLTEGRERLAELLALGREDIELTTGLKDEGPHPLPRRQPAITRQGAGLRRLPGAVAGRLHGRTRPVRAEPGDSTRGRRSGERRVLAHRPGTGQAGAGPIRKRAVSLRRGAAHLAGAGRRDRHCLVPQYPGERSGGAGRGQAGPGAPRRGPRPLARRGRSVGDRLVTE